MKALGLKGLALFALALAAAFIAARIPQLQNYYLRLAVGSNVVMITDDAERTGGTGFYVKTGGRTLIMSNSHVCEIGLAMPIFADGIPVRILKRDPKVDLCLLEQRIPDFFAIVGLRGLTLRSSGAELGELVSAVGHPQLLPTTVTTGEFIGDVKIQIGGKTVDDPAECEPGEEAMSAIFFFVCVKTQLASSTTAAILPGNSGSPVVDYRGRLVGVMFASDSSMRGFMVRYEDVKNFLEGVK